MDSSFTATKVTGFGTALRDRRGSATIEYALLAAVIAFGVLTTLAPFGKALSQEISALSRDHFLWSAPAEIPGGCQRVEWTDAALRHSAMHGSPEHLHSH